METIYVANLKASKQFGNKMLKGALCIDDLLAALEREDVQALIFEYEGKKFLNIDVVERKKANFGKTHYIKINDFVPDSSKQNAAPSPDTGNVPVASDDVKPEKKPRAIKKAAAKS